LISVVDAVCCVYFCAAGKYVLLVSILTELGMEILLRKRVGQVQAQWPRLRACSRVRILDALTVTDRRLDVVATVARLRGMSAQLALSASRDLGEAVVVGHARALADAGHEVYVVIDDQGGQALASSEGLDVLAVEDLLMAGLQLGILAAERLRKTYEDLIPFGSGLPTWEASRMKQLYNEWRQSDKQRRAESSI
jgi:hypothetical protein